MRRCLGWLGYVKVCRCEKGVGSVLMWVVGGRSSAIGSGDIAGVAAACFDGCFVHFVAYYFEA